MWPALWTMGNLGRAGYGATLEGMVSLRPSHLRLQPNLLECSSGHTHMMHATSVLRLTKPLAGSQKPPRSMATMATAVCCPTFRDNACLDVHALVLTTLVQNTRMVRSLVAPLPKLICWRPRCVQTFPHFHIVNNIPRFLDFLGLVKCLSPRSGL